MRGMNREQAARNALRTETADAHDRVDGLFSKFDLRRRGQYARFLLSQADAFLPLEAAVDAAKWSDIIPDWSNRKRSDSLRADLADFGLSVEDKPIEPLRSRSQMLGVVYVLEGSRLGGAVLVRSLPPRFPRRFLSSGKPAMWRALIHLLECELVDEGDLSAAVEAARFAFERFETSARNELEHVEIV